jgi:hypothetical protein
VTFELLLMSGRTVSAAFGRPCPIPTALTGGVFRIRSRHNLEQEGHIVGAFGHRSDDVPRADERDRSGEADQAGATLDGTHSISSVWVSTRAFVGKQAHVGLSANSP